MALSGEIRDGVERIISCYPERESALMPSLDLVQSARGGYVSRSDLAEVAAIIGIPKSRAFGVLSFYSLYNEKPLGRYHLQVDTGIPALLMGAEEVLGAVGRKLGIEAGETTEDRLFTLSTVECLASCGTCPVIRVNDRYYEDMTPRRAEELIDSLSRGEMPEGGSRAGFGTTCGILLKRSGTTGPASIDDYTAGGGYGALEKAGRMKPDELRAEVEASGLRGRGGAGFPAGVKWGFVPRDEGRPVYLVCNADEGEPGTFKDRQIMEHDPHLLIEGMAIAALAVGAARGFIYIRGEFAWIARILEKAIEEAETAGRIGRAHGFEIVVHRGAGAYICGEETALIESLEGKRGHPRLKPPFPAVRGLYGCPTIVNNVETLACLPFIISRGAAAFRKIGEANDCGPRIFSVSGHVNRPGTYECPTGTPLRDLLEMAGGVKGKLKAVIVGGLSAPIVTAEEALSLNLDFQSCRRLGTMPGSGGVIVFAGEADIPSIALRAIRFFAGESCGQCTPCRLGSHAVTRLLERVVDRQASQSDIGTILRICSSIRSTALCPVGDSFSMAIEAMITRFRGEFERLCSR